TVLVFTGARLSPATQNWNHCTRWRYRKEGVIADVAVAPDDHFLHHMRKGPDPGSGADRLALAQRERMNDPRVSSGPAAIRAARKGRTYDRTVWLPSVALFPCTAGAVRT